MPVLTTKLKNEMIKKSTPDMKLKFSLSNIMVNGEKRGCSGFIVNEVNGSTVYLTTEQSCMACLGYMYRYADNERDFRGYRNRWAKSVPELTTEVIRLLAKTPAEDRDIRV